MAERAQAGKSKREESRVAAIVMASVLAVAGLGFGVTTIVDALEPEGCGPYGYGGYGGYGCEPIGDATLVVAPSTDLVDRQMVTVTGERFGPSTSFGVAQCDPSVGPSGGIDACDLSTARTTTTDSDGRVQLTMIVRRIITVQGREVDCALEPCTVGAATLRRHHADRSHVGADQLRPRRSGDPPPHGRAHGRRRLRVIDDRDRHLQP